MYRLSSALPPCAIDVVVTLSRVAFPGRCRAGALAFALLVCAGGAAAQQDAPKAPGENATSMSLDELEVYIEEQKVALEAVRENRENVVKKAGRVDERLAEREARQAEIRAEMETLCAELAKVEPERAAGCADGLDEDRNAEAGDGAADGKVDGVAVEDTE